MNSVFQCCYTNAQIDVDGVAAPGWQPVAVSPGIPSAGLEGCVRMQSINSSMGGSATDEQGSLLNLFEVQGDEQFLYVVRTQYGLLDRVGRANMFSHGFIVPWNQYDALRDPNVFLRISDTNFKASTAEAIDANLHLSLDKPFSLDAALAELDIDPQEYLTLIQCVYARMTERFVVTPLYVQYDGTSRQMRLVLYCIYLGLPYHLRKRLSAVSSETQNTGDKTIVFSTRASSHQYYIVPGTGENNVISKRLDRKIARFGFADYAARNIDRFPPNVYFDKLAQTAEELGDEKAANPLVLKVAHRMVTAPNLSAYDEDSLEMSASDALLSGLTGLKGMELRIADLLDELNRRDLNLTDDAEVYLDDWLERPVTEELADAGERYRVRRFSQMPEAQAAAKLAQMRGSFLTRYLSRLAETRRGCRIADLYFSSYAVPAASSSWDELVRVYDESSVVALRPLTIDALQEAAWKLYCSVLDDVTQVKGSFDSYLSLMRRLLDPKDMYGCEEAALEEFWQHVSYDNISFDYEDTYRMMKTDDDECNRIIALFDLRRILLTEGYSGRRYQAELTDAAYVNQFGQAEVDGMLFSGSTYEGLDEPASIMAYDSEVPVRAFRRGRDFRDLPQVSRCEDEFLRALQRYASMYLADVSVSARRDRQKFERAIETVIKTEYAGEDSFLNVWAKAVMNASSADDSVESILRLRNCVNQALQAPLEKRQEVYRQFMALHESVHDRLGADGSRSIDDLVYHTLQKLDETAPLEKCVPLDLWLLEGGFRHPNAFEVFDYYEAKILFIEPEEVVKASEFFSRRENLDVANAYVKNRDSIEGATVKAWLKAYRNQHAKPRSSGIMGGFFSSIRKRS